MLSRFAFSVAIRPRIFYMARSFVSNVALNPKSTYSTAILKIDANDVAQIKRSRRFPEKELSYPIKRFFAFLWFGLLRFMLVILIIEESWFSIHGH